MDPLPSNGHPIVLRVGSCGNVFTESLHSNGYTYHNIKPNNNIECDQFDLTA
jgi:hypothetical protein